MGEEKTSAHLRVKVCHRVPAARSVQLGVAPSHVRHFVGAVILLRVRVGPAVVASSTAVAAAVTSLAGVVVSLRRVRVAKGI